MTRPTRRTFLESAALAVGGWLLGRAAPAGQQPPAGDVPWLAAVQQPPQTRPDDAPRPSPLLVDDAGRAIDLLAGWERRRAAVRQAWLEFLGPIELPREPPRPEVVEEDRRDGCLRQLVRYEGEPGLATEAYLLRPLETGDDAASAGAPGVVALHSTVPYTIRQPAGLEGEPGTFFGLRLARAGMVTLCPRCFLWEGEGSYTDHVAAFQARHPGSRGMAKMLWDASRGLDVLASLPEVDASRLGAVGHSLGAKQVLYLAALDERVQAAVASEGGVGRAFSNWEDPWYLGEALGRGGFDRDHHELLALAAPRAFLLVGGESADGDRSWPLVEAALAVYALYGEPRRIGLYNHRLGHAVPAEAAARIDQWLATYL